MKKRTLILTAALLMSLLCPGCHNKRQVQEKPDNLIGHNAMVNLIAESYIIESTLHTLTDDNVDKTSLCRQYYRELFDRYGVTREQFIASVEYYMGEESSAEKILSEASDAIIQKHKILNLPDSVCRPTY